MDWLEEIKRHLEAAKKLLNENVDNESLVDALERKDLPLLANDGIEDLINEFESLGEYLEEKEDEEEE